MAPRRTAAVSMRPSRCVLVPWAPALTAEITFEGPYAPSQASLATDGGELVFIPGPGSSWEHAPLEPKQIAPNGLLGNLTGSTDFAVNPKNLVGFAQTISDLQPIGLKTIEELDAFWSTITEGSMWDSNFDLEGNFAHL